MTNDLLSHVTAVLQYPAGTKTHSKLVYMATYYMLIRGAPDPDLDPARYLVDVRYLVIWTM